MLINKPYSEVLP